MRKYRQAIRADKADEKQRERRSSRNNLLTI